jgi:hypothetical protein
MLNKSETVSSENMHDHMFSAIEVLVRQEDKDRRKMEILKGVRMGNILHQESKIVFESSEGPKSIETIILSATDTHVMIRGGFVIPVHCIYKIEFV